MKTVRKLEMMAVAAVIAAGLLNTVGANAQRTEKYKYTFVDHSTGAKIKINEKVSFDLNGWRHVEKLKIKVKGPIPGFSVYANGGVLTPTYVPGPAPYYECPINQAINQFDVMGGGAGVLGGIYYNYRGGVIPLPGASFNVTADELQRIVQSIDNLLQFEPNLENQRLYLYPIKIAAAPALALQYGRGEQSGRAQAAVRAVLAQITFSYEYLKGLLNSAILYDQVVYLMSVKENLDMISE